MTPELHEAAAVGFDRAGAVYDRARPGYPEPILDAIVASLPDAAIVADVAAGTGKLTTMLAGRVGRVIAVEPVEGMRRLLAGSGIETIAATAERLALRDASVDAVTVAQAFHWFDATKALAEIARIVRPGGVLGVVFNIRDDSVGWVGRLWDALDRYDAEQRIPRHRNRAWQPHLDLGDRFTPIGDRLVVEHAQTVTLDGLVERVESVSFIAALDDDEHDRALGIVRDLWASDPDIAGSARMAYPYRCELDLYRRR